MVATSIHYIAGVIIAYFLGKKDEKKFAWGFWAVVPDLDTFILAFLLLIKSLFDLNLSAIETNPILMVLFGHRGFSHTFALLAIILIIAYLLKAKKQTLILIASLFISHLALDAITAWKTFLFLPFTYMPLYIGIYEVFDSVLTLLTMVILACFVAQSILKNQKPLLLMVAYLFVSFFGFLIPMLQNEFSWDTVIISQTLFWIIIAMAYVCKYKKLHKKHAHYAERGAIWSIYIILFYTILLVGNQVVYASVLGTSSVNIEPLEQFDFNYNAHTFEIQSGQNYVIGIISWKGREQTKIIPKIRDRTGGALTQEMINKFEQAYKKSIHINWFNHPVWTFEQDEQGAIYANVRYAKSFLDTPYINGPRNGLNLKLEGNHLVMYPESWFK